MIPCCEGTGESRYETTSFDNKKYVQVINGCACKAIFIALSKEAQNYIITLSKKANKERDFPYYEDKVIKELITEHLIERSYVKEGYVRYSDRMLMIVDNLKQIV